MLDGFSKAYAMTGWRLGYAHGPRRLVEEMIKLQQFTFVCAPHMVQYAGVAALDVDVASIVADRMGAFANVLPVETETICVEGVQPCAYIDAPIAQRSSSSVVPARAAASPAE